MSNTSRNIILIAAAVLLLGFAIIFTAYHSHSYNIAEGEIGNTAGNLNNTGLFCEKEGIVFFANPYDDGNLYKMNADQSDIELVYTLKAKYINVGDDTVFFYGQPASVAKGLGSVVTKPGIYKVRSDGKKLKELTGITSQNMLLVGNNLYYQHYTSKESTTFHVMQLPGGKDKELLNYMINPDCYYDGKFYFNGMYDDHYLYSYDVSTGAVDTIWEGDCWFPVYDGNYVYYMDVYNDYRLCRYSIPQNTIEILSNERLDCFNVYEDVIYYQVSSERQPALKRMRTDGSEVVTIAEGVFNNINITSTYTYFYEYGKERVVFCTPTKGAINVTEFTAAKQAVVLRK